MPGRHSAAQITTYFQEWVVPHPRATAAIETAQKLREHKQLIKPGTEARAAMLLADSQSGKTHTFQHNYLPNFIVPECRAQGLFRDDVEDHQIIKLQDKVIRMRAPPKPHLGAFAAAFLGGLRCPHRYKGAPLERMERGYDVFERKKAELLILESADHLTKLADRRTEDEASQTQDVLKEMIERGIPILFVGLPGARKVLSELQLGHRTEEIIFDPLSVDELADFIAGIDLLLVHYGIFNDMSDLAEFAPYLKIGCKGQIGVTSNLLMYAAISASAQGCRKIEPRHLYRAADDYLVRLNFSVNPFPKKAAA